MNKREYELKFEEIEKAVADTKKLKGYLKSQWYGRLMYDTYTGEVWIDMFYDQTGSWVSHYKEPSIVMCTTLYERQTEKDIKFWITNEIKEKMSLYIISYVDENSGHQSFECLAESKQNAKDILEWNTNVSESQITDITKEDVDFRPKIYIWGEEI